MAERPQLAPRHTQASSTGALARTRLAGGRNLFQNQLIRRPGIASTNTSTSTSSNDSNSTTSTTTTTIRGIEFEPAADLSIVSRDKKGDIEVFDPLPLIDQEGGALDDREEARRERERLSDLVRQMAVARVPGQDDDFLDALRISLRAKVCGLDEDNWMFEPEEPPRTE